MHRMVCRWGSHATVWTSRYDMDRRLADRSSGASSTKRWLCKAADRQRSDNPLCEVRRVIHVHSMRTYGLFSTKMHGNYLAMTTSLVGFEFRKQNICRNFLKEIVFCCDEIAVWQQIEWKLATECKLLGPDSEYHHGEWGSSSQGYWGVLTSER